jgi:hypothetical protein
VASIHSIEMACSCGFYDCLYNWVGGCNEIGDAKLLRTHHIVGSTLETCRLFACLCLDEMR